MFYENRETGAARARYPASLSYPMELDGATHLGRARRIIAEAGSGGNHVRPMRGTITSPRIDWERTYDARIRAMLVTHPGYPHSGTPEGKPFLTMAFLPRLDRMVSDLLPNTGNWLPTDEALYDVEQVDADLARHFGDLRRLRREGKGQKAVTAMIQAMQRLIVLTGVAGKTFPLKCAALTEMADLPDGRATHLVGNVDGSDHYDGPPPAGTIAFADLTLEALAYRLVERRLVGDRKATRYRNLKQAVTGHDLH